MRLSGSYLEMAEIRASIERGEPIDFTNRDPNIVAGLLKHFYRELPVPIFSRDINTSFAAVFSNFFFHSFILFTYKIILYCE